MKMATTKSNNTSNDDVLHSTTLQSVMSWFPAEDHPPILKKDHTDTELTAAKLTGVVIMSVLNVFMFAGNTMSIVTICSSRSLRQQVSYWFVLNLSIIDITISVTVVPLNTVWEYYGVWPFGQEACDFITFADMSFSTISAYSIALVAIDKYIYITHALHYYDKMTRKIAVTMIAVVWVSIFIFAGVSVFAGIAQDLDVPELAFDPCLFVSTDAFILPAMVICFFIPLGILCFTSSRIVCIARRHIRKIHGTSSSMTDSGTQQSSTVLPQVSAASTSQTVFKTQSSQTVMTRQSTSGSYSLSAKRDSLVRMRSSQASSSKHRRSHCKLFGTVILVILFFVLMFAPYYVASVVDVWCHCISPWVYEDVLAVLYYMHSLVNPYIYIATDRTYKAAVKRLWRRCFKPMKS